MNTLKLIAVVTFLLQWNTDANCILVGAAEICVIIKAGKHL